MISLLDFLFICIFGVVFEVIGLKIAVTTVPLQTGHTVKVFLKPVIVSNDMLCLYISFEHTCIWLDFQSRS